MSFLAWFRGPCHATRQRVLAALDEDSEIGQATRSHLLACPGCREYQEDHAKIQVALAHDRTPEPAGDFAEKTLAAWREARELTGPAPTWTRRPRRVEPWVVAASIAAVLLLSFGLVQFFAGSLGVATFGSDIASVTTELRAIGRNEMFPGSRDALLGVSFPSRSARIWNFR